MKGSLSLEVPQRDSCQTGKIHPFPAETHGRHSNWQLCSLLRHSSAVGVIVFSGTLVYSLINLKQDGDQTNMSFLEKLKNRYWQCTVSSWISDFWRLFIFLLM